jgi:DHA3 family macrolide efflux protein-like MFS transporter
MASRSVLAIRGFRDLFVGQAVSQFGDALYGLVFLFMVHRLTGDPAMVGYVGAVQALPYLLFGAYAGVVADRYSRRLVMLFSDVASVLILAVFACALMLDASPPVWLIFVVAFLLNAVNAFFAPAKSAAIPALVPAERLMEANSLSAATQNFMPMIGIAFSATVLGVLERLAGAWFFLSAVVLNALTFVFSASRIARLPPLLPDRDGPPAKAWRDLMDGLRFIRGLHVLKVALALGVGLNFAVSPFMVAYVEANARWMDGAFMTLAFLELGFVAAMVAGSLCVGRSGIARPGLSFIWGVAVCGLSVAALAFSPSFWPFLLWNVVAGLALPFAMLPLNTYVQLIVPDGYRGRVASVAAMAAMLAMPLGMGMAGLLLRWFGLANVFLGMGALMSLIALAGLADRGFREARIPAPAA